MIPYGKQSISAQDIDEVVAVLKSDLITQGSVVPQFEQAIAEYCHAQYALAVCNATAALHLACLALDVGTGDIVWTSPNTFVASANCALYCGASIDFVDIDAKTYNISILALKQKLTLAQQMQKLPKVVIVVHFAGQSCDMKAIKQLSEQYGFAIIEDASHALGAEYLGQKVGSCVYSDISVFSFHPVKMITTAEGGMLLTNQKVLANKMTLLRNAGITRETEKMIGESLAQEQGAWYYQQLELGYNYRLNDMQAALGLSQLKRLDEFVEKRREIADDYFQHLADLPLILPWQHPDTFSSWHLFVIRVNLKQLSWSQKQIFDYLRKQGIGVQIHYIPVHTQPYYLQQGFNWGDFPQSESYYQQAITIPLYYEMSMQDRQQVVKILSKIK